MLLPVGRAVGESKRSWRNRLTPGQQAELSKWMRQHAFHPHQLRHTAATELRRQFGLEATQAIRGHRSLAATQVYAERNAELAKEVAGAVG